MDMKIAGSGSIPAGEYDNVKVSGSGRLYGPIRCKTMHSAGSAHCIGDITTEEIKTSGSGHFDGNVRSSVISTAGSCHIDGDCVSDDTVKTAGSFKCDGSLKGNIIKCAGSLSASAIEAEQVRIAGGVRCDGLLNAENIEIKLNGRCKVGSIGGSVIKIEEGNEKSQSLLGRLFGSNKGNGSLKVEEEIEGDEISLENTEAKTVTGRIVVIGKGCKIDTVRYTESVEISPDAKVGVSEKIQ